MLTCQAQVTVDKLETLPDGTIVVEVGGKQYRGLPPEKVRDYLRIAAERDSYLNQRDSILAQFDDFRKKSEQFRLESVNNLELQLKKESNDKKFYQTQYEQEKKLREEFGRDLGKCTKKLFGLRLCWF